MSISADFELAWASRYVSLELALDEAKRTREYLPALLHAFNRHRVPVTWAVVGHLLLDGCERDPTTGRPHPDLPRPAAYANRYWAFPGGDWYEHDPCTRAQDSPAWYSPDLVREILGSPVAHEIGCHSFSHTDFSEANCPKSLAVAELRRCREAASRLGLRLRSFVFPGNFEGNRASLAQEGIVISRGSGGPDLAYPTKEAGLWTLQNSLQLFDPEVDYRVRLARYLGAARKVQASCHLSFHPSEPSPRTVAEVLEPALENLKAGERDGVLWIATMREVASYCEARATTEVRPLGSGDPPGWRVTWRIDSGVYETPCLTLSVPWTQSLPTVAVDGDEVPEGSADRQLRDGRLYITLRHPQSTIQVLRR